MSARSAYRERRRLRLPPQDFTPFAEEIGEGRPRWQWASFAALIVTATFVAVFLFLTP